MEIEITQPKDNLKNTMIVKAVMQGEALPPFATEVMNKGAFEGKTGQLFSTVHNSNRYIFYGLGEQKEFELDTIRRFAGTAVNYGTGMKNEKVYAELPIVKGYTSNEIAQALTEGAILASYKCIKFKSKQDDYFEVKTTIIQTKENIAEGVKKGSVLGKSQNFVRDFNENPANIATPQKLAELAKELAKQNKLGITVFEKEDLKKMKMNAILAVNQGSVLPPVLVILEYNKDKKELPLYAVVGKGITFDSGGISIKPAKGMQEMKYDKTGAVTTMGIVKAVSELQLPIRLLGVFAATENMPSGTAQRPGDIITAYSGKTIEVLNTDAEGRLILADALAYTAEKKPEAIIDLATLTGAMIIALGHYRIGLFSNNDKVSKALFDAGEKTFERVWRMPLDKEYIEMNKADFADIKNIGSEMGEAGSITAAAFLHEFIGDVPWAHLDIAGVDNIQEKHPYLSAKGATGIGVRLVTEALERMSKK